LDAPRLGSFQYHPSLLPLHRGPSSINWPIATGAKQSGLSIFWPDEGLDEGPILMQKECDIGADETLGDVYFKKLFPMGVDAMIESLDLVKSGKAARVEQDLDQGSYESWFGKSQAEVDWKQAAPVSYNKIRAANPQPGAWTTYAGEKVQIFDSRLLADVDGTAGEVLEINDDGIVVAGGNDGAIRISRLRPAGGGKISAADFVAATGLKVGDSFGNAE
jgi:methionyl-tRNA formyltransferase